MSNIKDKKVPNVPNLRFSEFGDEYRKMAFSDVGNFIGGGTPSTQKQEFWQGNIPWLSSSDISLDNIFDINITRYITQDAVEKSATKIVPSNSILLVSRVGVGKLAITTKEVCTSQDFTNLTNIKENVLYMAYLSKIIMQKLVSGSQGTSIKGVTTSEIKATNLLIPTIKEQEKIANFLTLIDERLATQNKIIEDLKKLRDGIVDRCFCDKGLYPAGEKLQLSEILIEGSKKAVNTKQYKKITIKLHQGGIDFFPNDSRKMTDTRPFYVRKKDEIIIGKQNYFNGSIALITEKFDNTICSNAIMSFSIKNCYDKSFIFLCLSNKIFLERREFLANGTGQKELSENDFLKFVICIPPIDDQLKISKTINSLSLKILQENAFMHFLTKQKQYLLQNMFV